MNSHCDCISCIVRKRWWWQWKQKMIPKKQQILPDNSYNFGTMASFGLSGSVPGKSCITSGAGHTPARYSGDSFCCIPTPWAGASCRSFSGVLKSIFREGISHNNHGWTMCIRYEGIIPLSGLFFAGVFCALSFGKKATQLFMQRGAFELFRLFHSPIRGTPHFGHFILRQVTPGVFSAV